MSAFVVRARNRTRAVPCESLCDGEPCDAFHGRDRSVATHMGCERRALGPTHVPLNLAEDAVIGPVSHGCQPVAGAVERHQNTVIRTRRAAFGGEARDRLEQAADDRLLALGTELLTEPDRLACVVEILQAQVDGAHPPGAGLEMESQQQQQASAGSCVVAAVAAQSSLSSV